MRMKNSFTVFEQSNLVAKDCANDFSKEDQWKCLFPKYNIKYVKTPFILVAD